jgi:hypothetical protein
MPTSTPLDKIDDANVPDNNSTDEERVKRIIQEMNGGANNEPPGREEMQEHPSQQLPMQNMAYHPMQMPIGQNMPMYNPQSQQQEQAVEKPSEETSVKKNVWAHITDILKLPFVVTVVFFLLSLPIVDTYLAKYANWAFSSSGTLTLYGIAVKAVGAGAIMGVYDTIDKVISRLF